MSSEGRTISTPSSSDTLKTLCAEHTGAKQDPRSCSMAVVGLSDGSQLPCQVEELSEQGAYLIRSERAQRKATLSLGEHVAVHLFKSGRGSVNSMIIDATVVRLESSGGPGLAVRFGAAEQEEDSPYNGLSSDDWMTEVPEIASLAASARIKPRVRKKSPKKPARSTSSTSSLTNLRSAVDVGRLLRSTLWASLITTCLALFVLFGDWLGAVL